jgi:hypothetical protein
MHPDRELDFSFVSRRDVVRELLQIFAHRLAIGRGEKAKLPFRGRAIGDDEMGSVNKAILVGNLGRDAEMRFTAGGTPVATVSLATTERFTDREGQKKEDTQWHRIVIWGKHGVIEALFDCLADWREVASDVRGRPLACGHFIPEEKPRELLAELRRFLRQAAM